MTQTAWEWTQHVRPQRGGVADASAAAAASSCTARCSRRWSPSERSSSAHELRSREEGARTTDPVDADRAAAMAVLRVWEQRPGPESTLRFEAVFDRERDRSLLVEIGRAHV